MSATSVYETLNPLSVKQVFLIVCHFSIICRRIQFIAGSWVCIDGSSEVEYRNWDDGPAWPQPDNDRGKENCGEVNHRGKWNDLPCSRKQIAFCKRLASTQLHL